MSKHRRDEETYKQWQHVYIYIYIHISLQNCNNIICNNMCVAILW
jgi:hypothetical protein